MKKINYILVLLCISVFTFAQEDVPQEKVKKEKVKREVIASDYLPATGDFAIGVDAIPFINFIGNMFNASYDQHLESNLDQATLYGKYFLSPEKAIRLEVFIDNSRDMERNYVRDDANFTTNQNAQVEDQRIINNYNYGVGVGYQQYRGYGRLRGTYGAVLNGLSSKSTTKYEWGNKMSAANPDPTSFDWTAPGDTMLSPTNGRVLEIRNPGSFSIGVGAIAGIEYYFAKKVCIGGELGVYYSVTWFKEESYKFQTVEQESVREYERETTPRATERTLSTSVYNSNNVAGRLYLLFHF